MDILSPSVLKNLCIQYGLSPSKEYGQNYLISDKPIRAMIESAEVTLEDTIVEIGPGFGVLTLTIAPLVKKLIAFEIEKKLEKYWEEKMAEQKNIEMVWGNALYKWEEQVSQLKQFTVIANLPYQITSHILRLILESKYKPEQVIVMVQKEVAERICAKPGDMSLLGVSVQLYGDPKVICKVPRGSFWPSPKVDSAVLSIKIHKENQPTAWSTHGSKNPSLDERAFFDMVRAGFSHPRKQLWSNLSKVFADTDWKVILQEVTGNEKIRAEELSVEDWKKVFYFFRKD